MKSVQRRMCCNTKLAVHRPTYKKPKGNFTELRITLWHKYARTKKEEKKSACCLTKVVANTQMCAEICVVILN